MDVILGGYVFFALVTAFVSVYELGWPVYRELALIESNNPIIQHKYLSLVVFNIFAFLFAFIFIFPCIIPSMGEKFRNKMLLTIKETH